MARIPAQVADSLFRRRLTDCGYPLLYQGKVGELYGVSYYWQRLMVRSDRLSIFDFVLPCTVERKGEVLIALTHYWLTQVFPGVSHHLLAWGWDVDRWQGCGWDLGRVKELPLERTLLVKLGEVWPYEMIFRAHLGGSVWKQYQANGMVAGIKLPGGLSKWEKLAEPIFTPTTKAESGHDIPVSLSDYSKAGGDIGNRLMEMDQGVYRQAYQHAAKRGILILDTKFENDLEGKLIDEVLTPDSSRFTTTEDLDAAIGEGRDPIFYDKEPVRIWGRSLDTPWGTGLQTLDPANEEHLAFVAGLEVPEEVIRETTARYLDIFQRITGMDLLKYQAQVMKVPGLD